MTNSTTPRLLIFAVILTLLGVSVALAQNKVVVIPLNADASAAGGVLALDATDAELGLLVNISDDQSPVDLLNGQNFFLRLTLGDGDVDNGILRYSDGTCSGTPHADRPGGSVFQNGAALYYVDRGSLPVANFPIQSALMDGVCSPIGGATIPFAWPASLNDPLVTGVSSSDLPYQVPIRFERR